MNDMEDVKPKSTDKRSWASHIWSAEWVRWAQGYIDNTRHILLISNSTLIVTEPDTTKLIPIEGNNQPTITVHTTLRCHFSPYYRAAIQGGFSERDNEFFDVDVDARTLEIAVFWMYSGRVSPAEDGTTLLEELVKVYLFADKYDFLALRRDVFARWLYADTPTPLVGFAMINLAHACLPANSPLLRFLAMTYIHHWEVPKGDEPERIEDLKTAPAAFLAAVLVGKGDDQDFHTTWDNCHCFSRQCEFHEHENPAEREATCNW